MAQAGRVPPLVAFAAAALGIAIYSGMDAVMKGLAIESGAYSAVLWRSIAGAAIMATIFIARRQRWPGRAALRLHLWRGLAGGISVLLFFWGLVRVPMARGVALTFLTPLIAIFLAAPMLGERVRRAAIAGSAVASLGVLVLAAAEIAGHAPADAVAGTVAIVAGSLLYAVSLVLLRQQAQIADPIEVALFTTLVIGAVMLAFAPLFAGWPARGQLPAIGAAAALGSVSAMLLAWAYSHAEAQTLAPVEYTAFVWSAILGYLVFGERVSLYTAAGAALIIAGCGVAVRRPVPGVAQTEAAA